MPNAKPFTAAAIILSLGLMLSAATASGEVTLPAVLSTHMVLQRDMPVPIWGTAEPGEKVTVKFRGQEKTTVAGQDGKWLLRLDPLKAGGPDTLTVNDSLIREDVLVGEVWVGSGQSNMDMNVGSFAKGDALLAKAAAKTYPEIRLLRNGKPGWQTATRASNGNFSALLFAFGVPLNEELHVPVGLMVGAVGGTPSGYWLSEEAFRSDAACQQAVAKVAATHRYDEQFKKYEQDLDRWKVAAEKAKQDGTKTPPKPNPPQKPGEAGGGKIGFLYERCIRPFMPYAIRGVLWDQGESGTAIEGVDQYTLMGALIRGWRKEWGQGDFPFIYIQKPSGGGCAWDPSDPVTMRAEKFSPLPANVPGMGDGLWIENHIRIMQYPNTAMATASDLGSGIHPVNKYGYGARAARVALGLAYGKKLEIYGPVYQAHKVEGDKVRVTLAHVGQGLAFRPGEKLQGFAVAGDDKVFHWADAVIDGDAVVASSAKVAKPAAVRYAWGQTYPWANLFNKDGLPALPFRSDTW